MWSIVRHSRSLSRMVACASSAARLGAGGAWCPARTFAIERASANKLAPKDVLRLDGALWVVRKTVRVKPGKGGAFVQAELRELGGQGRKNNIRLRSTEDVDLAIMDLRRTFTLLYTDPSGDTMAMMDTETFEQEDVPTSLVPEEAHAYLQDGMPIRLDFFEGVPVLAVLPPTGRYAVTQADEIRDDTRDGSNFRMVTLDNGARVSVPPFVDVGDAVIIKLETLEYKDRVKGGADQAGTAWD